MVHYNRLASLGSMIGCAIVIVIYANTDYIQQSDMINYMIPASIFGVLLGGAFAYLFWRDRVEFVATEDEASAKKADGRG